MLFNFRRRGTFFSKTTFWLALVLTYTILIKLYNLGLFIYSILRNITIDELYNPQYYPYLFKPSSKVKDKYFYHNDADRGSAANLKLFLEQGNNELPILN